MLNLSADCSVENSRPQRDHARGCFTVQLLVGPQVRRNATLLSTARDSRLHRFGMSAESRGYRLPSTQSTFWLVPSHTAYISLNKMRGHTYHNHILDALPERDQKVVINLVSEVQTKYTRYPALMVRRSPITWHDALEQIHKDVVGFLQDDKQLREHEVQIRLEEATPLHGLTLQTLRRHAKGATKWCKEVQSGLQEAERNLAPHFDQAWATKALFYLRDLYEEQMPQSPPEYWCIEFRANKAYKMMVSMHRSHGFPCKKADRERVLSKGTRPVWWSPPSRSCLMMCVQSGATILKSLIVFISGQHDSSRPLNQQANKQFRHKHFVRLAKAANMRSWH